jgi:uncharacterized membrane protein YiaA
MKAMLRRINDVLPELIFNILLYGVLVWMVGIWFAADKLRYSTGLLIGIVTAVGMSVNMAIVIRDTVEQTIEKKAKSHAALFSLLRYLVVVILFVIVVYFRLGSIVPMFLGVMGLKAAAYIQPFTHKILAKRRK